MSIIYTISSTGYKPAAELTSQDVPTHTNELYRNVH